MSMTGIEAAEEVGTGTPESVVAALEAVDCVLAVLIPRTN